MPRRRDGCSTRRRARGLGRVLQRGVRRGSSGLGLYRTPLPRVRRGAAISKMSRSQEARPDMTSGATGLGAGRTTSGRARGGAGRRRGRRSAGSSAVRRRLEGHCTKCWAPRRTPRTSLKRRSCAPGAPWTGSAPAAAARPGCIASPPTPAWTRSSVVHAVPNGDPLPESPRDEAAARDLTTAARYAIREGVELALLHAIQNSPAASAPALIFRDVLGWSAPKAAKVLEAAAGGLGQQRRLQRARKTIDELLPADLPSAADSAERRAARPGTSPPSRPMTW